MINSSSSQNNNNNNNNNNSNHYYSDLENVEITNNEKTFDKNKNTKEFMYQPIKGKIDDSKLHKAFNLSEKQRTVLIFDIIRPDILPLGTAKKGHTDQLDDFIAWFQ